MEGGRKGDVKKCCSHYVNEGRREKERETKKKKEQNE